MIYEGSLVNASALKVIFGLLKICTADSAASLDFFINSNFTELTRRFLGINYIP